MTKLNELFKNPLVRGLLILVLGAVVEWLIGVVSLLGSPPV